MNYSHRCIIPSAEQQAMAQNMYEAIGGYECAGMFVVGLSPNGLNPATHYISVGPVPMSVADILESATALANACASVNFAITPEQCVALVNGTDVSTDEPFDALARLDLALIPQN